MRWVNNSRILFASYFKAPATLPSFASQHITCRAATCHLRRHLTHQHTQRMTMTMSMMAEADEMQTMVTSAETCTSKMSKLKIVDKSDNVPPFTLFLWT